MTPDREREAERQRRLLAVLWRREPDAALHGWLADGGARPAAAARGLAAYRANAGAHAERALADACPTLQALVGPQAFAALARRHLHEHPPRLGDLGCWGEALPAALEADPQLVAWPYLGDVARLDLACRHVERLPDGPPADAAPAGLERLADATLDLQALRLRLRGGVRLRARHPVVTIRAAHVPAGDDAAALAEGPDPAVAAAREALARGDAEQAWVWRRGWRAEVARLADGEAAFVDALREGTDLEAALQAAGAADAGFDFADWLVRALRLGWLTAVDAGGRADPTAPDDRA